MSETFMELAKVAESCGESVQDWLEDLEEKREKAQKELCELLVEEVRKATKKAHKVCRKMWAAKNKEDQDKLQKELAEANKEVMNWTRELYEANGGILDCAFGEGWL